MPEKKTAKKAASKPKTAPKAKPKATSKPKKAATKSKAAPKKEATKTQKFFRTGEKCPQSGLYTHPCTGKGGEKNTIPLSKTETFPPCRSCGSVKWVLVMAA